MENKNAQLIRKYMNLMESIETKIIIEGKSTDINEDLIASAAREGRLAATELEGFLKMMKQDSKISADLVKAGIRDAEELLLALKGNKLSSTLKGSLELNILKSQTKNTKLIELASENLSRNGDFLRRYSNEIKQGQPQFEAALKNAGYSDRAITKIVEKAYLKKSSGLQTVAAKDRELANKQLVGKDRLKDVLSKKPKSFITKVENFTKTKGEELKKLLKSDKNWKKILAWGLGLGIPAAIIYWAIKGSGEKSPEGFPTTEPVTPEVKPTTEPVTPEVKPSEGTKESGKRRSMFTDRDKFPYRFGDRSPIIKEVQICFGFGKNWQTGNFGKHTLEFLNNLYDGTSEIDEDTYNRIKERCKSTPTTTTPAPTTPAPTTPVPTPTTPTPTSTTPTSTTPTSTTPISDEVKQEIRSNLKKRGIDGAYVYKGRDLTPDEQNYLIGYAKERGYEKFIPKEKMGSNDKYVFRK